MKEDGYIKLYRGLMESKVFANPVALKVWVWCLLKASHKDRFVNLKIGKGSIVVKIKIGQFIFGRHKAEEELDVDGTAIYRWINKFESDQYEKMITVEPHSQYTIITINKWEEYQLDDKEESTTNAQPTNNRCTTDAQPMHTDNNVNNVNNVKNREGNPLASEVFKSDSLELFEKREAGFRNECERYIGEYGKETIDKFILYWTEPNRTKTKMRFEKEATWDFARRIAIWDNNKKTNFGRNNGKANTATRHGEVSFVPGGIQGSSTL
jgi:hypothetical protein